MNERYKKLLQGSDEGLFLNGGCHVFVLALERQFHYPLVLIGENGKKNVPHIFCRSGEFAVDVMGFTIEKDILSAKMWVPPLFSAEIIASSDLEKYYVYTAPCPGLYADDLFMSKARLRAEKRITDYIRFYDGTYKCQIKPHQFLTKTTSAEIDDIFK
jgi:hypothetical protein